MIDAGVTPTWFVQCRLIGGQSDDRVTDRPTLDVRVWADGTHATEQIRSDCARTLLAHLRRMFPMQVVASPVPLPDPADITKTHTLFTIQLLTRGTQHDDI